MATLLANPNWPAGSFEVDFQFGPPNTPGLPRKSINAAYRRLSVRQFSTSRGRQYELDQIQAGTWTGQVMDPLELLNPDNPGSPFNTGGNLITPYRCMWNWWMWPNQPGSGNIINPNVHVDYDPSFELNPDAVLGLWVIAGGTTTLAQSATQHFSGTKALLVTQSGAGAGFGAVNQFRTCPDLTYTFSCYVFLTVQAGLAVTVQVVDANGTVFTSATTTTQGSWVRLSVTWNTIDTLEKITVYGAGVATPTFYIDATMLEFGASASAFTTTGPVLYPLFTGYTERFPTTYDMAGFRATRPLYAVDALAVLSRTAITQTYEQTILADNPAVYVPLSNTKPATSAGALSSGTETAVVSPRNITGNPNYFVPSNGSLSWAGDTQPDGTPALAISTQNATTPPSNGGANQDTGIEVLNGSVSIDTANGMVEFWARPVVGAMQIGALFTAAPGLNTNFPSGLPQLSVETVNTSDSLGVNYSPDGVAGYVISIAGGAPNIKWPDGQWHYFAIAFATNALVTTYDTIENGYIVTSVGRLGFNYLCHFAASTRYGDPQSQVSVARWAVYHTNLSPALRQAHYQRGIGYRGELAGARVTRLLNQYWLGGFTVAAGFMAFAPDSGYNTRFVLDVLQEIQESERGLVYADVNGNVVFEDRTSRYTNQTALWVFGENPAGASPVEYPYTDYATDMDPTYTFSQANLSRPGNSSFAPIVNAATQTKYGQRILTQTVQCVTDFDLTQAGIFYTQRYSTPVTRVSKLVLKPAANPALWPVVLSLEISQRIRVKRRNAGLTITGDYYIEKISHRVNADTSEWDVELQLSPVFVPSAWVLGDNTYGVLGSTTVPVY